MSITLTVTCIKIQIIYRPNTPWHILLHFHCMEKRKKCNTIHTLHYPLNAELNPICNLQALLGSHHILLIFRIRVKLRLFSKSQKNIMKYK